MGNFLQYIKDYIKGFAKGCATAQTIETDDDYQSVQKWVKKTGILYIVFTAIALLVEILLICFHKVIGMPSFVVFTLFPVLITITCWGYATLIMYLPDVVKSVFKAGKAGYKAGEKIQTTHVQVTHEYGNQYRVSSYTEDKGCLFAIIAGSIRFMVWAFFCVYVAPFLHFKKLKVSWKNMQDYSNNATNV